jgi:hypothetical protein
LLLQRAILITLVLEKNALDQFAAAVIAKVPAALQGVALATVKLVNAAFNASIAVYEES